MSITSHEYGLPAAACGAAATEAELLYADGRWRSATVLRWYRLGVAHRQPITQRWIFWLVQLRLADGDEAWFEYDSLSLRPIPRSP